MQLGNFVGRHKRFSFFVVLFMLFMCFYAGADRDFQEDSEALVIGAIRAERADVEANAYGLGNYVDINGAHIHRDDDKPLTGIDINNGYMTQEAGIAVRNNGYVEMLAKEAKYAQFTDGMILPIARIEEHGDIRCIYFDGQVIPSEELSGKLEDIRFLDEDQEMLPPGIFSGYGSQYGLPGKVFAAMASLVPGDIELGTIIEAMHILCKVLAIIIFIAIGYYVGIKYNNWLLAAAFWLTFLTATWVRDFAINLYWVEFIWFIPMLIGLYCSIKGDRWLIRWLCYIMAFVALLVKSLSGYEYLSTIIIALVMFPITDAYMAWHNGEKKLARKAAAMVVGLGIAGLLGFGLAISMHADIRGNGNIGKGVESIYQRDILRRTWAGEAKGNFGQVYQESFEAGLPDMAKKYILLWNRDVVFHLPGRTFILLFLLPMIMYYRYHKKKRDMPIGREIICLYIISFIGSFSWYALAKSHSYIHTFINFVLWYFGFVQVCVYIAFAWIRDKYFPDQDTIMTKYDHACAYVRSSLAKALEEAK